MSETLQSTLAYLLPLILTGVAAALAWGLIQLSRWLGAKAQANKLWTLGVKLTEIASAVVRDIEATVKPEAQRMGADGKLTPDEARRLRDLALARLKSSLGEQGLAELRKTFGLGGVTADGFLAGVVEERVAAIQKPPAPVMAALKSIPTVPTVPLLPHP